MAVNNLADISLAGVTAQLQVFGRIGMASADAISDMARNGFLDRPTTNKEMSDKKKCMFHDFPEELQITAVVCAVKEAPAKRHSNTNGMDRHHNSKQERNNLVKREGLEKAAYEFIQCLIYRHMWDSVRRWNTADEVKREVRALKLKKETESGLKENTQMQYKVLGKVEAKTTWSNNGKKKIIPELQDRLVEIIKLTKQWHVLYEPPTTAPHRIEIRIVGTLSNAVKGLDIKAKTKEIEFNKDVRKEWQWIGETSVL